MSLRVQFLLLVLAAGGTWTAAYPAKVPSEKPWPRHTIDNSSRGADGVRLADVNGDGLQDIATGWEEGGKIRVYLNPGAARATQPWPSVNVGDVAKPEDAVFADLDGDGAMDVISSTEGETRKVFVHWAPENAGRYLDAAAWKTEAVPASVDLMQWMFALPMQIDGKHGADLVAGAKNEGANIGWFQTPENPRDLAEWKWHPLYDAGWIMSLVSVDMDGDGDLDVLGSDRYGPRRSALWLENPGAERAAAAEWKERRIGPVDEYQAMFLTVADLDRDWLDDVLIAVRGGPLRYHRRTKFSPASWETHAIELPPNTGTGKSVAVGDIDLDGKPDIVFSCENARGGKEGVMWMSYRKAPTDAVWDGHPISGPEGVKFDLVQLIDLDDDGDLDVVTCEEVENLGVVWYENPLR